MKNNKNILNEAFFKKASYEEKREKRLPQYSPVDLKKSTGNSANTIVAGPAYQVSDTDEVKRRLASTFGVAFGSNNVKGMASRAIKEFPILISDAVEPETALMIKRLVEEQYAEYISLLISNQVVNLADYSANDSEGNIAIQALDSISGSDFRRSRIADKAAKTGNINADTIFQNIPLFNLLRENQMELKTGEAITDALLENAIVIPSNEVERLIEFMDMNSNEIQELLEGLVPKDVNPTVKNDKDDDNNEKKPRFVEDKKIDPAIIGGGYVERDIRNDIKRGFQGLDDQGKEIYTKITTGDIVLNQDRFDQAINKTVGEMLTKPENAFIRDRFEKATFLLQSRRISGLEYYNYLTLRLCIPVSDAARMELFKRFKTSDIRKYGKTENEAYTISKQEAKAISQNRLYTEKTVKLIAETRLKDVLIGAGITGASAGVGLLVTNVAAKTAFGAWIAKAGGVLGTVFAGPWAGAIVGAAVGGGAFLLAKLVQKLKEKKKLKIQKSKIQGWERVEMLIDEMDRQQESLRKAEFSSKFKSHMSAKDIELSKNHTLNTDLYDDRRQEKDLETSETSFKKMRDVIDSTETTDYLSLLQDTSDMIDDVLRMPKYLKEDVISVSFEDFFNTLTEEKEFELLEDTALELAEEYQSDKEIKAEMLTEKVLGNTSMPLSIKYVEKKKDKDILVTPSFMARDNFAYGSTEIDRKSLKERRYNQPLIMTVKFRERFSDDKFSDNELTAVIGILGKIIRIPSEEMQYILSENADGKTIDGILKSGDIKDAVADILSTSKISKDLKNLPQSADVWRNLEKVTALAAANKMSGKRSGNISNAHIIFAQKEVDAVRNETGVDYLKDLKKALLLMKRYSAFTIMIANDAGQRMCILDDQDAMSWNVIPYTGLSNKESGEQLSSILAKMSRI